MNYDNENHIIEYIEGKKVKQFKVPKNDYNLDFNKMSYNDILTYIKLVKEDENKHSEDSKNPAASKIKYKPLKTVAAKTKDYFAQDFKLMSQAEKLKTLSEYMLNENIQELKEFLTNDVFTDEPIVQSLITILNKKGYLNDEVKELLRNKKDIDLYTSVIKHCIVKNAKDYSFINITFKNTIGDILDLSKQFRFLQNYTIFVPMNIILFDNDYDKDTKKDNINEFNDVLFKGIKKLSSAEGQELQQFMTNEYIKPSVSKFNKFIIHGFNNFKLSFDKIPYYLYDSDNGIIYLNIKYLYYLLQHDEAFKNNNYKHVVEKLQRNDVDNIIFTAGSAFDLDNVYASLEEYNDETINYYDEYIKLMSEKLAKYFDKKFTPVVKTNKDDSEEYIDFSDIEKPKDLTEDLTEDLSHSGFSAETEDLSHSGFSAETEDLTEDDTYDLKPVKPIDEHDKEAKGLFRRDTKETLKALLNRIIKLESLVSVQADEIKQLKNGIKSINQALPDNTRKQVFGNYFAAAAKDFVPNSINEPLGGALNPNKVYPKITFTEVKKLYKALL